MLAEQVMGKGDIYQHWANATPTNPFPFTYSDKKVGKLSMSWAEVRAGTQRDAVAPGIPFCTAHIQPSAVQSKTIEDAIQKSERQRKQWFALHPEWNEKVRDRSITVSGSSSVSRSLLTAKERDILFNSEGGRGRIGYLKLRRALSPAERFGRPLTASHAYGWAIASPLDPPYSSDSASSPPRSQGTVPPLDAQSNHLHGVEALTEALTLESAQYDPRRAKYVHCDLSSIGHSHQRRTDFRRLGNKQLMRGSGVLPRRE